MARITVKVKYIVVHIMSSAVNANLHRRLFHHFTHLLFKMQMTVSKLWEKQIKYNNVNFCVIMTSYSKLCAVKIHHVKKSSICVKWKGNLTMPPLCENYFSMQT